jgi:hypothetical protein
MEVVRLSHNPQQPPRRRGVTQQMELFQGATVYAGDRVRIVMAMTGKDATGQVLPTPIPPDAIVEWSEGQMSPGSNLAFETETSRFDTIRQVGGPASVVVLVDKASQSGAGVIRVNYSCKSPDDGKTYWVTGQCRLSTAPGERPMASNPTPISPASGVVPQNVTFKMELLPREKPPGK